MGKGFADGTVVAVEKSQAELQGLLKRMGCTRSMFGEDEKQYTLGFTAGGVSYLMVLPKPDASLPEYNRVKVNATTWTAATPEQRQRKLEAEEARRMRCLCLLVKAKVVAVEEGISTFEREFMANIVTGDGLTVADHVLPELAKAVERGEQVPALSWKGSR